MLKKLFFILLPAIALTSRAQLLSPEDFLGYELGSRFTRHHQVVNYFGHLSANSPNVVVKEYGQTYEKRPLLLAFVSSEKNLARLESVREDNLKRAGVLNGNPSIDLAIIWLSYNVHGNESASTEAALATIYELLRPGKADWLENTLVIIDPCVNPDGRERYVNFYFEHGNMEYNPHADAWEHREAWPGGRGNHFLFDLNRDWAWQTQVESRQRMEVYNQWLPHVHVDFHEQGINEPYYFAPAAEPLHELITDWQRDFQVQIGKNHSRYFDKNNWFYFTKQYFDLLYPSYGDTYPMYSGAIGMTYEQGGSGRAGLGVIKQEGDTLTLKDRISHHFTTGLSTIEVTTGNGDRVLQEFQRYFNQEVSTYKTFILKYAGEADKFRRLKQWLDTQGIRYGTARNQKGLSGYHYGSGTRRDFSINPEDLVISTNQPKSILTSVLFEPQTRLSDSLTYDITSWAVPYAYGIDAFATTTRLSVTGVQKQSDQQSVSSGPPSYGFIFKWNSLDDARFLSALLGEGIQVRYTTRPIQVETHAFGRGSFIVTKRDNDQVADFETYIANMATRYQREPVTITSGFVTDGPDIGSDDVHYLKPPRVALLGGAGISSLNFGSIWHFFEQELNFPVTTLSLSYFRRIDLNAFDVLILPDGGYGDFKEGDMDRINEWVLKGGKLIAVQGAIRQLVNSDYSKISSYNSDEEEVEFEILAEQIAEERKRLPKAQEERYEIREYVAGAVFRVALDNTHPLAYGYSDRYFSLKTSADRYAYLDSDNVGIIESAGDHLSGFAGSIVKQKVGQSLIFGVESKGSGKIVYMVDDPLFRSFWHNGKLLFANAVFYVGN